MSLSAEIQETASTQLTAIETESASKGSDPHSLGEGVHARRRPLSLRSLNAVRIGVMTRFLRKTSGRTGLAIAPMAVSRSRRRLTDLVAAVRRAIPALGPDIADAQRSLTPRQVAELSPFMALPLTRPCDEVKRIVYLGDLSPYSGVADFMACVVTWAERHLDDPIELHWVGTGDLQGVLRAQPTPANLTQVFVPSAEPESRAELMQRCSLLAAPNLSGVELLPMVQGMAAGLPVLGSLRCPQVKLLVASGINGWLFDPLAADQMLAALHTALTVPAPQLNEMRMAARRRIDALYAAAPLTGANDVWRWGPDLVANSV